MHLTPRPILMPGLSLAGFSAKFISAMSPDTNHQAVIPPLWGQYCQRQAEFHASPALQAYGACRSLPLGEGSREDELEYLAGLPWTDGMTLPKGAVTWDVPEQFGVLFVHRGPLARFQATLEEIYGEWYPRSEYLPVAGVELEIYGTLFNPLSDTSEFEYFVPSRRKTRMTVPPL